MSSNSPLKIAIAEPSAIIRSGLVTVLKRIPNLDVHPVEITSLEALQNYTRLHEPDIIIVNPYFDKGFDLPMFKAEPGKQQHIKYIALIVSVTNDNTLKDYDEHFSICDDTDIIAAKINRLVNNEEEEEEDKGNEPEALSLREKEIIACVVKGMTNKAIADKLYLSIHTVITHRRNISRKLQIHSSAGLTIYAIVNKLVELQDVKGML